MFSNILVTKLYAPLSRRDLVPRARLIQRLNSDLITTDAGAREQVHAYAFARKLSLISAPAGYGKTTLAVTWIQQARIPFAWLSLDEDDNDPARFTALLVAALNSLQPGLGSTPSLGGPGAAAINSEAVLTDMINALAASLAPSILVFDDYHVIHNVAVHRQLNFLLENLPTSLHLVIISREDPPAPLPRLRAARQIVEIRQADLSFNREEIADFFHRVLGLEIGAGDLDSLAQRTEGWVVGLQMVALSLQSGLYLPDFLQSFTGSHRFIMDYLIDEVFNKLPDHLQDFLLKVSILDRFSAPLCAALTGRDDCQEILAHLEASNSFLVSLDPYRNWYRFHHLFADLLRQKLRQARSISEKELHRIAGAWLNQNGYPHEAIQHALAGEDWPHALAWIQAQANQMLRRGEVVTLLGWLTGIPDEQLTAEPRLAIEICWPLILNGQLEKSERLLKLAETAPALSGEQQGGIAAAQAFIARARGDDRLLVELSKKALAFMPVDDLLVRGLLGMNLGIAYWNAGRLDETERVLQDSAPAWHTTDNRYAALTGQIFLNRVLAARGQLRKAFQAYQPLKELLEPMPVLALVQMDIAALYYEWNELDACAAHLQKSLTIARQTRNKEFECTAYHQLAKLKLARGDLDGATEALHVARQLVESEGVAPSTRARNAAAQVELSLAQGKPRDAAHWFELAGDSADAHPFYPFAGLSRARLLLAEGQVIPARQELEKRAGLAKQNSWGVARLAFLVLQAVAASAGDDPAGALAYLKEALAFGQPEGFLRTFVDAGPQLAPLLCEAARQGIFPEYAGKILNLIQPSPKSDVRAGVLHPREPLSERELEVLRLVAAGRSNRQIAEQLVVGLSTVKSHVHHISAKLGAENRTQLAALAREQGLI